MQQKKKLINFKRIGVILCFAIAVLIMTYFVLRPDVYNYQSWETKLMIFTMTCFVLWGLLQILVLWAFFWIFYLVIGLIYDRLKRKSAS
jgi:hypothetical protein